MGDSERCERVARRAVAIDPEGISTFWSMQVRCDLGAALCHQGRLDEGLTIFHDAWADLRRVGLRVNGGTYFAECALGLVRAGRVEEAREALEQATTVRMADSEHYGGTRSCSWPRPPWPTPGEPTKGGSGADDPCSRRLAVRQGAKGVARRVEREAAWFGHSPSRRDGGALLGGFLLEFDATVADRVGVGDSRVVFAPAGRTGTIPFSAVPSWSSMALFAWRRNS